MAVVVEHTSENTNSAVSALRLSSYFVVHPVRTIAEAEHLMAKKEVRAILRFPPHFSRDVTNGDATLLVP
ncbi:hypothetical protein [Candidatus Nitrotoga fabula]|uniref:Uncharacterized protein n=1 Tax=Candidatus Nitrotoga fabula TaxID=2182327 RepID=A0A916BG88_9PROT|nr:hypothetical protein NTGZN8_240025 [Candidatus Nitrotoga fabula]